MSAGDKRSRDNPAEAAAARAAAARCRLALLRAAPPTRHDTQIDMTRQMRNRVPVAHLAAWTQYHRIINIRVFSGQWFAGVVGLVTSYVTCGCHRHRVVPRDTCFPLTDVI